MHQFSRMQENAFTIDWVYCKSGFVSQTYIQSAHRSTSSRLRAWVLGEGEVREHLTVFTREELLALLALDERRDDDILTGLPVDRRGELVLVAALQRLNDTEDLIEVAADLYIKIRR